MRKNSRTALDYLKAKNYELAKKLYTDNIRLDPSEPLNYFLVSLCQKRLKNMPIAEKLRLQAE